MCYTMGRMDKVMRLISCDCGWRGTESGLKRGGVLMPPDDFSFEFKCPRCGRSEFECQWFEINESNN